ncbi:protein of unknown function [Pseudomonas sp. JV241A]|nr:protein of unknown function [Pseudomonas sp. JV241A]
MTKPSFSVHGPSVQPPLPVDLPENDLCLGKAAIATICPCRSASAPTESKKITPANKDNSHDACGFD